MGRSKFYFEMELLQNTLIATATQDEYETGNYDELRSNLLSHSELKLSWLRNSLLLVGI
jgi:hypothetical protein